jgi:hypothetical protein
MTMNAQNKKTALTTELLDKDTIEENTDALEIMNFYFQVSSIIERTHIAMGKKVSYKLSATSTTSEKLNTNAFSSTH